MGVRGGRGEGQKLQLWRVPWSLSELTRGPPASPWTAQRCGGLLWTRWRVSSRAPWRAPPNLGTGLSLPAPFVRVLGLGVTARGGGMRTAQMALQSTAVLLLLTSRPSLGKGGGDGGQHSTRGKHGTWHSRDPPREQILKGKLLSTHYTGAPGRMPRTWALSELLRAAWQTPCGE